MQKFDMFMVEKWPLIQAFALDGIGRGSFFTMKYKVGDADWAAGVRPSVCLTLVFVFQLMDMSEKLWQVYNRLDPVSLNQVITEVALPLLPDGAALQRDGSFISREDSETVS